MTLRACSSRGSREQRYRPAGAEGRSSALWTRRGIYDPARPQRAGEPDSHAEPCREDETSRSASWRSERSERSLRRRMEVYT